MNLERKIKEITSAIELKEIPKKEKSELCDLVVSTLNNVKNNKTELLTEITEYGLNIIKKFSPLTSESYFNSIDMISEENLTNGEIISYLNNASKILEKSEAVAYNYLFFGGNLLIEDKEFFDKYVNIGIKILNSSEYVSHEYFAQVPMAYNLLGEETEKIIDLGLDIMDKSEFSAEKFLWEIMDENYILNLTNISDSNIDKFNEESNKSLDKIKSIITNKKSCSFETNYSNSKKLISKKTESVKKETEMNLERILQVLNPILEDKEKKHIEESLLNYHSERFIKTILQTKNPRLLKGFNLIGKIINSKKQIKDLKTIETISIIEELTNYLKQNSNFDEELKRELYDLKNIINFDPRINKTKIEFNKNSIDDYFNNLYDCLTFKGKFNEEGKNIIENNYSEFLNINSYKNDEFDGTIGRIILFDTKIDDENVLYVSGFSGGNFMRTITNWEKEIYDGVISVAKENNFDSIFFDLNPLGSYLNPRARYGHDFAKYVANQNSLVKGKDYIFNRYGKGLKKPFIFELNPTKKEDLVKKIRFKRSENFNGNFFLEGVFLTKEDAINSKILKKDIVDYKPDLIYDEGYVAGYLLEL